MDRSAQNRGTAEVREAHRFDVASLAAWMEANVEGFAGPLCVEQFKGGQSNPTYKLLTPGRTYVLRRKPPGKLLPGAHAVDREHRVISALGEQGFPVARAYGLCLDEAVIGTQFYVMEMVEGRIFWDPTFAEVRREDRPLYFDAMNETIARLHLIDPNAAGLGDYGKPGNYFARQIARWSQQYQNDVEAGRVASMDRLVEWLPENIPPDEPQARVPLGEVEVWRFVTDVHHPVHVHLDPFRVLRRGAGGPGPWDAGWKDTVDVRPAEVVDVAVRFTDHRGRYVMHCHNLEHEDMAMMAALDTV